MVEAAIRMKEGGRKRGKGRVSLDSSLPLPRQRRTIPRNLEQIFYHSFVTSFGCHAFGREEESRAPLGRKVEGEGREEGRDRGREAVTRRVWEGKKGTRAVDIESTK